MFRYTVVCVLFHSGYIKRKKPIIINRLTNPKTCYPTCKLQKPLKYKPNKRIKNEIF